jgi:hypothetical protein
MTDRSPTRQPTPEDSAIRWDAFGITLLRSWKALIGGLGLCGLLLGIAAGLLGRRRYVASATFIPQASETTISGGLALAASQFGIQLPTTGGTWGPPIYVELLQSQALLEPIALDTLEVAEEGGRRVALMNLLKVPGLPPAQRTERAVKMLRKIVAASEDKRLNGVKLTVTTLWPSVSLALAERLVRGVNQFNLETRKSQAAAERQFVEVQAAEAERALREAEDRLQSFLQRNRSVTGSPELMFAQDRLQREVGLRQAVYTSLMQRKEEARIREVRDTPVITVLENPRLPATGEPRRTVMKGVLGAFAAAMIGILVAFVREGMAEARRGQSGPLRGFVRLLDEAAPGLVRREAR